MVAVAIVLLMIDRTGSPALAGAAVTAYTLPSILSGPVLGAWLDRARRRTLILAGNEILLAAVATGLVLTTGHAPIALTLAITALAGLTLPMTSGGFTSLLPSLVPAGRVTRANAVDAAVFNTASITGPAVAAAVATAFGSAAAVGLVGITAAVGAVATLSLRVPDRQPADGDPPPLLTAVRTGLRHLLRTPPLRGATVASALGLGSVGMLTVALPLRTEQLGAGREANGWVWAAIDVGCLVSVLVVGRHLNRWPPERIVFCTVGLYGLVMLSWPAATSLTGLLGLGFLAGIVNGPTLAALFAARQRYSPAALLGQVSTTGASLKTGMFALGAALGGVLTPKLGAGAVLLVMACAEIASAALGWLATIRFAGRDATRPADSHDAR
ncbi:MFS transporter [Solihabitans fulvus]|uniref:MFS transporter n=2 Tax=Solihabitans fulvus TaxID=1892852 RepID=A0A5B2WT41_9PSEU|nr:MFS transporter [Solihabitans fulvus]